MNYYNLNKYMFYLNLVLIGVMLFLIYLSVTGQLGLIRFVDLTPNQPIYPNEVNF